jgi:hypothetical protein
MLDTLARHLADRGPIATFSSSAYSTAAQQTTAVDLLRGELLDDQAGLTASWGTRWYNLVAEMAEVELASIGIRANRESNYDQTARDREVAIKSMVDRRLDGYAHGTVVSAGNTHAQKSYLMGTTDVEWLGDYLVHRSPYTQGAVFVIAVTPALIMSDNKEVYNVMTASPADELWRVMHETRPDQNSFLPLDDVLFSTGMVPMNFDGTIYNGAPKDFYDAFILLQLGHKVSAQ